jgi:hypothetical protein
MMQALGHSIQRSRVLPIVAINAICAQYSRYYRHRLPAHLTMTTLEELGCFLSKHQKRGKSEKTEESDQNQPIPPCLVILGFDIFQEFRAAWVRFGAILEFGNKNDADCICQRTEVTGPTKPSRDKRWGHKEPSKKHLRNKQQRQHLLSKLGIFDRASQQHGQCSASHRQRIYSRPKDWKPALKVDEEVCYKDLKKATIDGLSQRTETIVHTPFRLFHVPLQELVAL